MLETAARLAPTDTSILYDLGIACQRTGQTEKADELHRRVNHLYELRQSYEDLRLQAVDDPRDAEIRYRLGVLAAELDDSYRARQWLKAAVRLDPAHAQARAALEALGPEAG